MKIAVVHNLPFGGQRRALFEQVKRLSMNNAVDLFTLSCTDENRLSLKPFVRRHYVFDYSYPNHFPFTVFSIYFQLPRVYKKMALLINKGDYDVVFANPCFLTQAPYILKYLVKPSVYYCPEPKREFYEKIPRISNKLSYSLTFPFRLPLKKIDRENARKATRVLTNSRYSQNIIQKIFSVSAQINYLGINTNIFKPKDTQQKSQKFVLSVGEISLHKGHDFIINSLSLIEKKIRPDLKIVGPKSTETDYLMKLAVQKEVKLDIMENIDDTTLINLYREADVLVFAGLNEPFGLNILEAISCGCFVLAVDEGGVREIISDDKIGKLVKRDVIVFAEELNKILEKAQDDKKYRHDWVRKKWNWERSVKELEKILMDISKHTL